LVEEYGIRNTEYSGDEATIFDAESCIPYSVFRIPVAEGNKKPPPTRSCVAAAYLILTKNADTMKPAVQTASSSLEG
jgi:hypothetical protein